MTPVKFGDTENDESVKPATTSQLSVLGNSIDARAGVDS